MSAYRCRENMMETMCRMKLLAAAHGERLPPDLEARWPFFVVWFQGRKAKEKGSGVSDWWLQYFVGKWAKAIPHDPSAFVKWVRAEMVFMPRPLPASTTRL